MLLTMFIPHHMLHSLSVCLRNSKPWGNTQIQICPDPETCGKRDTKLLMCHRQGDGKYKSICVSETAASARQRKGDTCGRCREIATCNDDDVCTIDIEGTDGSCTYKSACPKDYVCTFAKSGISCVLERSVNIRIAFSVICLGFQLSHTVTLYTSFTRL
jgi:hypothetical protein